jgi:hypothetical protein
VRPVASGFDDRRESLMLDKSGKHRWLNIGFRCELLGERVGQQILGGGHTHGGTDKKAVHQREARDRSNVTQRGSFSEWGLVLHRWMGSKTSRFARKTPLEYLESNDMAHLGVTTQNVCQLHLARRAAFRRQKPGAADHNTGAAGA